MVTAEYNIWSLHSSLCINIKPRFPKLFIRLMPIDLDCPCTSTSAQLMAQYYAADQEHKDRPIEEPL